MSKSNANNQVELIGPIDNESRREAVKKTVIGAATLAAVSHVLPTKWSTPVIEQIILPAHAKTSPEPCTPFTYKNTQEYSLDSNVAPSTPDFNILNQTFTYPLGGARPTGDVTLTITNLAGDFNNVTEKLEILLGGFSGTPINHQFGSNIIPKDEHQISCTTLSDIYTFTIPQAQFLSFITGDAFSLFILNDASDGDGVSNFCDGDKDGGTFNTLTATLEFSVDCLYTK